MFSVDSIERALETNVFAPVVRVAGVSKPFGTLLRTAAEPVRPPAVLPPMFEIALQAAEPASVNFREYFPGVRRYLVFMVEVHEQSLAGSRYISSAFGFRAVVHGGIDSQER